MKTFLDCIPCFVRQTLDSVRRSTDDVKLQERALRLALRRASKLDFSQPPPVMALEMHRTIRALLENSDPYRKAKAKSNQMALDLYPALSARVKASAEPFETALRLAIAGNIIDLGVKSSLRDINIPEELDRAFTAPLNGEVQVFLDAIREARDILYLADNAGEIVLDRLLLEQILSEAPDTKITVVVRGAPVINDATMADARVAGITELTEVIDNGSDAPGTVLEECSPAFRRRYAESDLIISKGQGNYETLSEEPRNIFFLLKAKCSIVADAIDCKVGSLVLHAPSRITAGATMKGI